LFINQEAPTAGTETQVFDVTFFDVLLMRVNRYRIIFSHAGFTLLTCQGWTFDHVYTSEDLLVWIVPP